MPAAYEARLSRCDSFWRAWAENMLRIGSGNVMGDEIILTYAELQTQAAQARQLVEGAGQFTDEGPEARPTPQYKLFLQLQGRILRLTSKLNFDIGLKIPGEEAFRPDMGKVQ